MRRRDPNTGRSWLLLAGGAVVGLALGILVSVTTDVPFAPEIGVVVGLVVAWAARRSGPRS